MSVEQERKAFEAQLEELLNEHRGEYALVFRGESVAFYPDSASAYEAGLERFGVDAEFLVAEVAEPSHRSVSLAWDAGVMFG